MYKISSHWWFVIYNTYVTMSYVGLSLLSNGIAEWTFSTQLPFEVLKLVT